METTNTTEITNDPAEENLAKLDTILDEYSEKRGLKLKFNEHVTEYLNYSVEDFNRLTTDNCGEIAASLATYSIFLLKEQNRQSARVRWCESVIDLTIAKTLNQFNGKSYTSFDEKKLLAIQGNSYTKKLNELRIKASVRLSEIFGLASKIDLYVKTLLDLQQSKRKSH